MTIEEIKYKIKNYKSEGKRIFATSSFQTQSIVLLHIISKLDNSIPVYFINTGYLFPETLMYKDLIQRLFNLKIISLRPHVPKNLQKDINGNLLFTSDPDFCCYLNKTQPLDSILAENDVWISGVRASQNENRKKLSTEGKAPHNVIRFHPLIEWTDEQITNYINENNLPVHSLDNIGYKSIGCEPCTRISESFSLRDGRWFGLNKTECGLHTELNIK